MPSESSKKKIKYGSIKADPDGYALLVNYEVEQAEYDSDIDEVVTEHKSHQKRIKIKTLSELSNLSILANDIVSKCKVIHSSKVGEVESLLRDLLERKLGRPSSRPSVKEDQGRPVERASMDHLEDYIDQLYDDHIESKVEGILKIQQLCHIPSSLENLIQNEALMGLLSRVLNEEYKKSHELVCSMMQIFLNFSNYIHFHETISNYRVGAVTMKIVEFEIKRHNLRLIDTEKSISENATSKELEKSKRRMNEAMRKQDKLFFLCFYVLLNLAEDLHTERKMVKKKLVLFLSEVLDRNSTAVLITVVTFLKKLSVFEENKDIMLESQIIEKLMPYIPCSSDTLIQSILRLFFNLSFDQNSREIMVKSGLIPKLVDLLKRAPFRALSLRIMYHLSMNDRCKSMFTYTEGIPIIRQLVIHFPQNMVARELVALTINLTHNGRNAELMCQENGSLRQLMERVLKTRDPLLMKVIRNLSQWSYSMQEEVSGRMYKYAGMWTEFIKPLIRLAQECENHDLLVEILGTLANITPLDLKKEVSWPNLISKYSLLQYFYKLLVPGFSQDDIVLEAINCIATITMDPNCAAVLSTSQLVQVLHNQLREKTEDSEISLQILFCFHRMLRYPELLDELLYGSAVLSEIITLGSSSNPEVKHVCDEVLDIILDHDMAEGDIGEFARKIRRRRFTLHNAEYLETPVDTEMSNTFYDYDKDSDQYAQRHEDYGEYEYKS